MPEHTDPLRFPLQHHLDAHTNAAGRRIGLDALDPTEPRLGSLVTTLIEATARDAAATHLRHLPDAPLSFLLEVIGDGPIDNHEGGTAVLAALVDAGFLAALTEHRAARRYQTVIGGDTVHAGPAADGGFTLHSTGHDGSPPWHITATGSTPAPLLTALIRACTAPRRRPTRPGPDGRAGRRPAGHAVHSNPATVTP